MNNEVFYKIASDGRASKVTVKVEELLLQQDLLANFSDENPVKIRNLIDSGILRDGAMGRIGISANSKAIVFTIHVAVLPMRAAFSIKDGVLMPDFSAEIAIPVMDLKWVVPTNMRVFLLVHCPVESYCYSETQFLVAMDKDGRTYRLPTSNCYEDCKLCTGSYVSEGPSYIDVLCKAWKQFMGSAWQKDLMDRATGGTAVGVKNSQLMFRYKPNEKEGFEQLPPAGDWTLLSNKIGNDFITTNIVI